MAAFSGVPTVIASSKEPDVVATAIRGGEIGTWVDPRESSLSARKLWIAFGTPSEGVISVDHGAARAIRQGGKSLLPVGVTQVEGRFEEGSAVEVLCSGQLVAKGLVAMSSDDVSRMKGEHSSVAGGEVIHRDDLVVLT
jgi:glutamate 5-kinase